MKKVSVARNGENSAALKLYMEARKEISEIFKDLNLVIVPEIDRKL
jgi:hypothetical protein